MRIKLDLHVHFDERVESDLCRSAEALEAIAAALRVKLKPQSATLIFFDSQGEPLAMPLTIQVGQPFSAALLEWSGPNGTGTQLDPIGPVTFASDNAAVATIDPASGQGVGVAPGTANISGSDAGDNLSAADVLTVVAAPPPPAVSATLQLTAGAIPAAVRAAARS